jgi:PAS domain S-box-containing protein
MCGSPSPDPKARPYALAEKRLADASTPFNVALGASQIATWVWDVITDKVYGDANLRNFFDVTTNDLNGGPLERYLAAIHPEDRGRVSELISRAMESSATYVAQYRVRSSDRERWVVARGKVERDSHGNPVRFQGVVLDVSEHERAEKTLREGEAYLRSVQEREQNLLAQAATANAKFRAFFEQGPLFAGIMALDGIILEANRLSLEACGYTKEQIVGKPFWECPWWSRSASLMEQIK